VEGPHTQKAKKVNLLLKMLPILLVSSLVLSGAMVAFSSVSMVKAGSGPLGTLIIDGDVANPLSLTLSNLQTMPPTTVYSDLLCGGLLVTAGNWQGVQLSYLLQQAGADPSATFLEFHASDSYSVVLDMYQAESSEIIIAYQLNDLPLTEVYRLVLPGQNGASWISLITEIAVTGGNAYNNYLNYTAPPPTNSTTTPPPAPTATPTTPPTSFPTAPPTVTPAPPSTTEPTTPPPVTNITTANPPQTSPEPANFQTPTTPPTNTPQPSPIAEPTQPANNTGPGDNQVQPQDTAVSGSPVVPIAMGSAAAIGLLAAALIVLRRRGFGR
jgi:DMSO/TMAO reductase YedYZ molybdopterin-dependent catalytic subunit